MNGPWRSLIGLGIAGCILLMAGWASAEPVSVKAVMSPKEQIQYNFPTPDKHFVLMSIARGP